MIGKNAKKMYNFAATLLFGIILLFPLHVNAQEELLYADGSQWVLQEGGLLPTEELGQAVAPQYLKDLAAADRATAKEVIHQGLLNRQEQIDISQYGIPSEGLSAFYFSTLNEYPDLFFVEGSISYYSSGKYLPVYSTKYNDTNVAIFNDAVDKILAQVPSGLNEKQKALWVHDYLVTHCEYDKTYNNYNAYNALVEKSAVCQGYSLAFLYLAGRLGVKTELVTSESMNHAWNIVKLDGAYYHTDCTWDDPSNSWYEGYCDHKNFLRSESKLVSEAEHSGTDWTGTSLGNVNGLATSTLYDAYFWKNVTTAIPMVNGYYVYINSNNGIDYRKLDESNTFSLSIDSTNRPWWYSSLATDGKYVYYNNRYMLYRVKQDRTVEQVYELSTDEKASGVIYGIVMDGDAIAYNVGNNPYNTTFIRNTYEIPADLFQMAGANMNLGNALDMNFFINASNLEAGKEYYVVITKAYADKAEVSTVKVDQSKWQKYNDSLWFVTLKGISAKEMNDRVTVQVFYSDGTAASQLWEDSVVDYVKRAIKAETADKYTKDLMVDMLHYGAAAQVNFGYDTGNLADAWLAEAGYDGYGQTTASATNKRVMGDHCKGSNLNLGSSLCLNVFFENVTNDMYAIVTYKDHNNKDVSYRVNYGKFVTMSGFYGVPVNTLSAADADTLVTCTMYNGNDTIYGSAQDSIASYLARMKLTDGSIYTAIKKFCDSANAYFHR